MARALSEVRPFPRRGLSRDEAAMYVGISPAKFDQLVADGRMPGPVQIDARKIWDIRSLDLAFDDISRGRIKLIAGTACEAHDSDQASTCQRVPRPAR
jgi:predicted DNA-binding transcriptional regulator AlpA